MPSTCREIFRRLSDYLDGGLSRAACEEIQRHLARCPECRTFTNTFRKTIEICRGLPQHPVPPDVRQELRTMVRGCLAQGHTRMRRSGSR